MKRRIRKRRRATNRLGGTTVEVAVTFPVLLLFLFAHIEFSRANMVRHALVTAAFQGCRAGIVLGTTAQDVEQAAHETLQGVGLEEYSVTVTPSVINHETRQVTVEVSAPLAGNSWIAPSFLDGIVLSRTMTMEREQHDQTMF